MEALGKAGPRNLLLRTSHDAHLVFSVLNSSGTHTVSWTNADMVSNGPNVSDIFILVLGPERFYDSVPIACLGGLPMTDQAKTRKSPEYHPDDP